MSERRFLPDALPDERPEDFLRRLAQAVIEGRVLWDQAAIAERLCEIGNAIEERREDYR